MCSAVVRASRLRGSSMHLAGVLMPEGCVFGVFDRDPRVPRGTMVREEETLSCIALAAFRHSCIRADTSTANLAKIRARSIGFTTVLAGCSPYKFRIWEEIFRLGSCLGRVNFPIWSNVFRLGGSLGALGADWGPFLGL